MDNAAIQAVKTAFNEGLRLGAALHRPRGADLAYDLAQVFPQVPINMVFDVGANVGQSAMHFAEWWPQARIFCFEPAGRAYDSLVANTRHLPKVTTYQIAMSDHEGVGNICVPEETSLSSMEVSEGEVERVDLTTVDTLCRLAAISHVDLLKIDTEGHDLAVLLGAVEMLSAHKIRFVQVEASMSGHSLRFIALQRFILQLAPFGYELFALYDQMPHLSGHRSLQYFNAVFVCSALL